MKQIFFKYLHIAIMYTLIGLCLGYSVARREFNDRGVPVITQGELVDLVESAR